MLTPHERAVLAELRRRDTLRRGGLMEWIPRVSPDYQAPVHLAPLVAELERARRERVRLCVSVPPRHGKTDTILHAIAWWLANDPTESIAYVSYNSTIAEEKAARAKRVAIAAGVKLGGMDTQARWETAAGGCVAATGIRGVLTGRGFTKIVVDDAFQNHEEAESPTMREKNWHGFLADIQSRLDPRGTSFFVAGTRWHVEDLIGHLVDDMHWPAVNLPALDDRDEALWPAVWSAEMMRSQRAATTAYLWNALYQGNPVPRGGALFGPATYCERRDVPRTGVRVAVGLDLAYSGKTHSNYSVQVILVREGRGPIYVADVLRVQMQAAEFAEAARARLGAWPGAPARWYTSTTEKGTADLLGKWGLRVEALLATSDKFVRAQPAAAAWQHGEILVPRDMPWTQDFVDEVRRFSGLGDKHDDQVDALAAAYDLLARGYDVRAFVAGAAAMR